MQIKLTSFFQLQYVLLIPKLETSVKVSWVGRSIFSDFTY